MTYIPPVWPCESLSVYDNAPAGTRIALLAPVGPDVKVGDLIATKKRLFLVEKIPDEDGV
jgi:hypothetical protein